MKKIAVLISGQGSNLQAIIEACQTGFILGKIVTVISNKIDSFGLERAESAGIPSRVFLRQDFTSNLDMDKSIGDYLEDLNVDLIVLAGYMKILTKPFTQRFTGKILNIHPSLLPKYPRLHTYQRVPIFPGDTIEEIELRTREQEYNIYPLVIKWFIEERLKLENDIAYLDASPLPISGYAAE